jgi:hypothetical protein
VPVRDQWAGWTTTPQSAKIGPAVIVRLLLSVLVSLVVGLGTVRAWQSLQQYNNEQIARIAESESYAAAAN